MQQQLATWQFIQRCLQKTKPVVLLYVLESHGSSPGREGFMMAIAQDGTTEGSIGGGIMEHKFVELAKAKLARSENVAELQLQVHRKDAPSHQSGMICSGEQTIFLYRVRIGDEQAIEMLVNSMLAFENGTLYLSPAGISFDTSKQPPGIAFVKHGEDAFSYATVTGYKHRLYIVGGGHCALALSRLMSTLDFYLEILDDREAVPTIDNNTFAHKKTKLTGYAALSELVPDGEASYVVVMTTGYRSDAVALKALLGKHYKYLGVLGSENKIRKLFRDLRGAGVDEQLMASVRAPVGLKINSRTPAEIAISIAAEIIMVRNGGAMRR